MKLKALFLSLVIAIMPTAFASAAGSTEIYKCSPGIDCHFSYLMFETIGGTRYLKSEVGKFKFWAKFISEFEAEGAVQVEYQGTACSFAISVRLEKKDVGYNVVSEEAPIPDSIYRNCPPPSPKVIKVHSHTYLSKEKRDQIVSVSNITLLDPKNKNPNRAFAGTWRIDPRFHNNCSDQKNVDLLQFNCDAASGPQVQVSRRLNESDERCFNPDSKLPIDPLVAIKFSSVKQCQSAIATLRENYTKNFKCGYGYVCPIHLYDWGVVALKATGVIMNDEQLSGGNF